MKRSAIGHAHGATGVRMRFGGRRFKGFAASALVAGAILTPAIMAGANAPAASAATASPWLTSMPTGSHTLNNAGNPAPRAGIGGHVRNGISGIQSIPNWSDHFNVKGLDNNGNVQNQWLTNIVGNPPQLGGTTTIDAPVIPVSVELLDSSGNPLAYSDATQFESNFLNSPDFNNATYSSSSTPTQFSDAIQRAEYYKTAKASWHTDLNAIPTTGLVAQIPYGSWEAALNGDGTCCRFVLVDYNTFNNVFGNVVNEAVNDGLITTADISTFMFPNTYLYLGDPSQCCVLGYHTYFFNDLPNGIEQRWVLNYSSFISPGLFGGGFQDVTAVSHEIAETFNDPFVVSDGVHNLTPWWLSPNGNCQNDLETGDVIEGLSNAVYPITMNGYTYHPQNEALTQWFETGQASNAIGGAYSYPDTTVLTSPSTYQNVNCT
jgi:hypothetical protein